MFWTASPDYSLNSCIKPFNSIKLYKICCQVPDGKALYAGFIFGPRKCVVPKVIILRQLKKED